MLLRRLRRQKRLVLFSCRSIAAYIDSVNELFSGELLFTSSQAWPCSPPPPGGISPFILQLLNGSLLDVDRLR